MKRKAKRAWLAPRALGLLLALLWSLAAGAAELSAQSIKVGAVIPLTGRYASVGNEVKHGYEIAIERINQEGGVPVGDRRLPIELSVLDDESDATKTVARLETHAAQGVVAYLGGVGSDLHAAGASIAEKNRIPYLGVGFALESIHKRGFRYLFSPFWKSPDIVRTLYALLDAVPSAQRPRGVAVFQEKTDWGREMAGLWASVGQELGYRVVLTAEYAPGARDFSDAILKAKAAGAEAVFGVPSPPDGMTIVKQMRELDFTPKALFFARAPDSPAWSRNLGKAGDFTLLAPGWHHALRYPGVAELNEAYARRFNRPADPIVGPGYAAVQVLADALARAGALDREKIRNALAATSMTTVMGPVKFRPDGTAVVSGLVIQWQKGRQELVWPREFATASLVYPAPPWAER